MKRLLDVLIILLIVVLVAVGGFVGYTIYQDNQDSTTTTTTNNPTQQPNITGTPSTPTPSPTATPDPSISVLPVYVRPCTEGERQETIDLVNQQTVDLFRGIPDLSNLSSIQDFSKVVLDVDELVKRYNTEYRPLYPFCADAYPVQASLETLYDNTEMLVILNLLSVYVQQAGNQATANTLTKGWQARQQIGRTLPSEQFMLEILQENDVFPEGIASCDAATIASVREVYTPYINDYRGLYPEYVRFMESRQGDFNTLYRFEEMAQTIVLLETDMCPETVGQEIALNNLLIDTSIAIHMAQLAAFEQTHGNADTATAMEAIVAERNERVMASQGLLNWDVPVPVPTATEG